MKANKLFTHIVGISFVLVLAADFYYKYFRFCCDINVSILPYIKSIIGLMLSSMMMYCRKLNRATSIGILILILVVFTSLLLAPTDKTMETLVLKSKFLFGTIVLVFFFTNFQSIDFGKIKTYLFWFSALNFICIIAGFIFEIYYFETYSGNRFGYNGLFKSTSTASYFYIFSMTFLFFKQNKTIKDTIWLLILIMSALFVGSKTSYIFVFLASIIYFTDLTIKTQNILSPRLFLGLTTFLSLLFSFFGLRWYLLNNSLFKVVVVENGFWTAFFSQRDIHFQQALMKIKTNYGFQDIMLGGVHHLDRLTELAVADLFISLGLVGGLVFLYVVVINFPRTKNLPFKLFLALIGLTILLRGNFLYYPSVIYLSILIFTMTIKEVNKKTLKQ